MGWGFFLNLFQKLPGNPKMICKFSGAGPAVGVEAVVDLVAQGGAVEGGVPAQAGRQVGGGGPHPHPVLPLLQGGRLVKGCELPEPVLPLQPEAVVVGQQGGGGHQPPGEVPLPRPLVFYLRPKYFKKIKYHIYLFLNTKNSIEENLYLKKIKYCI